jgi:transcriptional regulator with XRE-family HTH domain
MGKNLNVFGESIQKLRKDSNLSQPDITRRSRRGGLKGISDGYVSQIESGLILPENLTVQKIIALGRALNTPPTQIFNLAVGVTESKAGADLIVLFSELSESRQNDLIEFAKLFYAEKNKSNLVAQENDSEVFHPNYQSDDEETFKPNYQNSAVSKKKAS